MAGPVCFDYFIGNMFVVLSHLNYLKGVKLVGSDHTPGCLLLCNVWAPHPPPPPALLPLSLSSHTGISPSLPSVPVINLCQF